MWADAQDDRSVPAEPLQITNHLKFLAATLPSKNLDDDTGKRRFAVYSSILSGHSNDALAYMARRACAELDWFPTPRQCLELLREYTPPTTDKQRALLLCDTFWQKRFEAFIAALKEGSATQDMVDSVSLTWRRIAEEQGYLRYLPEESRHVIRGPNNRIAATEPQAQSGEEHSPRSQPKFCPVCLFDAVSPEAASCRADNCGKAHAVTNDWLRATFEQIGEMRA